MRFSRLATGIANGISAPTAMQRGSWFLFLLRIQAAAAVTVSVSLLDSDSDSDPDSTPAEVCCLCLGSWSCHRCILRTFFPPLILAFFISRWSRLFLTISFGCPAIFYLVFSFCFFAAESSIPGCGGALKSSCIFKCYVAIGQCAFLRAPAICADGIID